MAEQPPGAGEVPPEKGIKCPHCPQTFDSVGELSRHLWTPEADGGHRETMLDLQKKGREKAEEEIKKKAEEEARKKGAPPTPPGKEEPVYKGEPDANAILRGILETHPDIGEAVRNEIMSWAEYQTLTPQTVAYLLSSMRGVHSQTANIVAQKYSLALQRAQLEARPGVQMPVLAQLPLQQPPFQVPIQGYPPVQYSFVQAPGQMLQQQPGVIPQFGPQPQQPLYGYPPAQAPQPQPPGVIKADVEEMITKSEDKIVKAVGELLKEDREKAEKDRLAEAIGKQAEATKASSERTDKLLEKIEKGELFPKPAAPTGPPVTPPTKEEIADIAGKAASEAATKVLEARTKEDKDERRHSELLSAIRSSAGAQAVSGYKEDSYRLLGQGLQAVAGALSGKEPLKIIIEKAPELLYGPGGLQPKEILPEAAGAEMAGRIKPEWVVEE